MDLLFQKIILPPPIGSTTIVADTKYLKAISFGRNRKKIKTILSHAETGSNGIIEKTKVQLQEYLAGMRTKFDLPLTLSGTDFQIKTWQALLTIPHGKVISYSEQATLIGNPKAVRAVGQANRLNPIAIVVPCHRVIGKSGALTGYAGGLEIKKFLLDLERKI